MVRHSGNYSLRPCFTICFSIVFFNLLHYVNRGFGIASTKTVLRNFAVSLLKIVDLVLDIITD